MKADKFEQSKRLINNKNSEQTLHVTVRLFGAFYVLIAVIIMLRFSIVPTVK